MQLGVGVHNPHVMNTVCPLLPEVTDQQVALLFRDLQRRRYCVVFFLLTPTGAAFVLFTARPE